MTVFYGFCARCVRFVSYPLSLVMLAATPPSLKRTRMVSVNNATAVLLRIPSFLSPTRPIVSALLAPIFMILILILILILSHRTDWKPYPVYHTIPSAIHPQSLPTFLQGHPSTHRSPLRHSSTHHCPIHHPPSTIARSHFSSTHPPFLYTSSQVPSKQPPQAHPDKPSRAGKVVGWGLGDRGLGIGG